MRCAGLPILAAACVLVAGCTTPAEYAGRLREIERTTPVCDGDRDCTAKWDAAQLWVVKNIGFKLQNVTSVVIDTYNSTDGSTRLAATVTKEPLGGGRYKIIATLRCANIYGCQPNHLEATIAFNRAVGSAIP